jgi:cell division protein FtsI (penicillin-binding protein 3)
VNRWSPSSIGSIAIGQEVAVTPLQLVSMVSTIADGGVYLPPHLLMPDQSVPAANTVQKPAAPQVPAPQAAAPQLHQPQLTPLAASPVRPGEDLPDPLPTGAHRVISTMAAAEMRKMMEGVVLYGTGKQAQLNGYSSAGKTGTAQKIDPATHTYSKTMHIASFAGFAPVNDPVIAVAIIIDSPKGAYYGAEVSAPVFAEVAQEVLEYLGAPHDIELRPAAEASKKEPPVTEDDAAAQSENIQALYEAANDLPSDDPLRAATNAPATANAQPAPANPTSPGASGSQTGNATALPAPPAQAATNPPANAVVIVGAAQLRVPSLLGLSVRQVIEEAGSAGLEVEIDGSGTAREQVPAPGAMVAPGTKIVVRCAR